MKELILTNTNKVIRDALSVEVMYRYYKAMVEHIERNKITEDDYPKPEHPSAVNDDTYHK